MAIQKENNMKFKDLMVESKLVIDKVVDDIITTAQINNYKPGDTSILDFGDILKKNKITKINVSDFTEILKRMEKAIKK